MSNRNGEEDRTEKTAAGSLKRIFPLLAAALAVGVAFGAAGTKLLSGSAADSTPSAVSASAAVERPVGDGELYDYAADGKVVLGNYKSLTVSVTPAEEDIDAQLQYVAEEAGRKAAARKGDYVFIDYIGMLDGQTNDDLTASDVALKLGDYKYEKAFEDQLIGKKAGSMSSIKVHFRDDYPDSVAAGKTVDFSVSLRAVLSDAEIKKRTKGKYTSIAAYRRHIKDELKKENVKNVNEIAWSDFTASCEVNGTPSEQVQEELDALKKKYAAVAEGDDVTYEELLSQLELTEEDLKDQAEANVKERMLAKTVAVREGITLTDDAYWHYLMRLLGYTEEDDMSLEEVTEEYREDYGCRPKDDILLETVKKYIGDKATQV